MTSKSPEAQASIGVLRALLNVQKHPIRLSVLLKEYKEMEGRILPYRQFGFKSAEEFLKMSGEFLMMFDQGEVLVGARPNKDSAHIVKMVACQKPSRKRSNRTYSNRNRMPKRDVQNNTSYLFQVYRNFASLASYGNLARRTAKPVMRINNFVSQTQNSKPQKFVTSKVNDRLVAKNLVQKDGEQLKEKPVQSKISPFLQVIPKKDGSQNLTTSKSSAHNLNKVGETSSKNSERDENSRYNFATTKEHTISVSESDSKISNENNLNNMKQNEFLCNKARALKKLINNVENNSFKNLTEHTVAVSNKENLQTPFENTIIDPNKEVYSNLLTPPVSPLNEKLDVQTKLSSVSANVLTDTTVRVINENNKDLGEKCLKPKISPTEKYEFNFKLNPVTSLEQYCLARGFEEPRYDSKYYNGLLFSVMINGKKYTTYPKFFNDMQIAKNACAAIAIEEIKLEESKIAKYPVSTNSDSDLLLKIYEELKINHTSGIFVKMFPKFFELKFQQSLPDHWFSLVESSKYFLIESTVDFENAILVANLNLEDSDNLEEMSGSILESITLPWDKKYWNLYITHCESPATIWARIIDNNYSQKLETLLNQIEQKMLNKKTQPDSILTGQHYLVSMSETWHRVYLQKMNDEINRCLCFFIDFGDKDWVSIDELYVCDKEFLKLPPQAISFSLFGLQDFTENPIANKCLNETIMGASLVAEILTKKEIYESNESKQIDIVLYDTSSHIDIIINEVLIERICAGVPIPELKQNSPTNVNITHITDRGDIYLQILDSNFYYLQKLILQLIESKFQHDQYKVKLEELNLSNLYLVADEGKWYRGSLVDIDVKNRNAKEFKIFYVDYGLTKQVNISNIFSLESLSTALNRYPRQAIKTKMYNMPPSNEFVLNKLKSMLPDNSLAIVKSVVNEFNLNGIPQVIVFIRIEKNQSLCNVNDAIRIEYELISNDVSSDVLINESSSSSISQPTPEYEMLPIELHSNINLPEKGEIFNVLVTVVTSPFDFYIRPQEDSLQYENMMTILQNQCQNNKEVVSADMIEPGEAYAACLKDGIYYRCIIEKSLFDKKCSVYFCDRGDRDIIDIKSLCSLPGKCRDLPTQAIKAKLHGIIPIKEIWSQKDNDRFYELTAGKNFIAVVKHILFDHLDSYRNSKVLELKLIDQSNDVIVHEILLEENRAILS
ncbi:tudor domain-containing protein 7B-like [Condylostylus longicornis]|uniref:tudor domain-containing protein 7B-like n=1 Tax=Condylostylus longicornis TaxID=2530218 RepID=UPI00244E3C5E|nr:tudor domain-containing protein 7B-like [Condylostylus longicornis]